MLLGNEPAGQRQPIGRTFRQWWQNGRRAGRDLLALVSEIAAHEDERVPRRIHFLHDQRRGNRFVKFFLALAGLGQRGVGAQVIHRIVLLVEALEIAAFLVRPVAPGFGDERQVAIEHERTRVFARERSVVETHVIHQPLDRGLTVARTDAERFAVRNRGRQAVLLDLDLAEAAVHIKVHAFCFSRPVIGGQHMQPLALGKLVLRPNHQGIVRPGVDQMHLEPFLREEQIETAQARALLHPAQYRAVAVKLYPRAVAEGIGALEPGERAEVGVRFAVELERLADVTVHKLRFLGVHHFACHCGGR